MITLTFEASFIRRWVPIVLFAVLATALRATSDYRGGRK
jgi:hypothetical protein